MFPRTVIRGGCHHPHCSILSHEQPRNALAFAPAQQPEPSLYSAAARPEAVVGKGWRDSDRAHLECGWPGPTSSQPRPAADEAHAAAAVQTGSTRPPCRQAHMPVKGYCRYKCHVIMEKEEAGSGVE